jgi:hypothetical protein
MTDVLAAVFDLTPAIEAAGNADPSVGWSVMIAMDRWSGHLPETADRLNPAEQARAGGPAKGV